MPLLTKLGIRRQAKLDPFDYSVLAEDLAHLDLRDIQGGLDDIAKYPRREGETAFPELPRLKQAILERKAVREAEEVRQAERDEAEHRRKNPEMYCSWAEVMNSPEAAAVVKKIALAKEGKPVIAPARPVQPIQYSEAEISTWPPAIQASYRASRKAESETAA